jgi:hypothetical protein
MHFQTTHVLLLILSLALSLFVFIAATRYAMWSRPMIGSGWMYNNSLLSPGKCLESYRS